MKTKIIIILLLLSQNLISGEIFQSRLSTEYDSFRKILVPEDYPTIQQAIDATQDGDTISVAAGTYYENLSIYIKDINIRSRTGAATTIIDGENKEPVIYTYCSNLTVKGFTIRNGGGINGYTTMQLEGLTVTVSDCIIIDNFSELHNSYVIYSFGGFPVILENTKIYKNGCDSVFGGDRPLIYLYRCIISENYSEVFSYMSEITVYMYDSIVSRNNGDGVTAKAGEIVNCKIVDNSGRGIVQCYGAGIYVTSSYIKGNMGGGGSATVFDNCMVIENYCDGGNGGISGEKIRNSTVINNISTNSIGGITVGSGCTVENCLIKGNDSGVYDVQGGIGCFSSNMDPIIINNCTIVNNSGGISFKSDRIDTVFVNNSIILENWNSGIIKTGKGSLITSHCNLWNNSLNYGEGTRPGEGDISEDPLFVNPEANHYQLHWGSPCIDSGDPASPRDPDSTRADIGAYFFNQQVSPSIELYGPVFNQIFPLQKTYYDLWVYNLYANKITVDIWEYVILPDGQRIGPLNLHKNIPINPNGKVGQNNIPLSLNYPEIGVYEVKGFAGTYPTAIDSSSFVIMKQSGIKAQSDQYAYEPVNQPAYED